MPPYMVVKIGALYTINPLTTGFIHNMCINIHNIYLYTFLCNIYKNERFRKTIFLHINC